MNGPLNASIPPISVIVSPPTVINPNSITPSKTQ
jgi:hypothetical protein